MQPRILSKEEIEKELPNLSGWTYAEEKLSKEFEFKDFVGSLSFVNRLVGFLQTIDHHPDVHIFYNKIKFELQSFDVGGKITDLDILLAKKIDQTYAS